MDIQVRPWLLALLFGVVVIGCLCLLTGCGGGSAPDPEEEQTGICIVQGTAGKCAKEAPCRAEKSGCH